MNHYEEKQERLHLARTIAEEGVVLLQNNDHFLPLEKGSMAAVFGSIQFNPVVGGSGSGASRSDHPEYLNEELKKAGLLIEPVVESLYAELQRELLEAKANEPAFDPQNFEGLITSGAIYEIFGKYNPVPEEPIPSAELIERSAAVSDTAVLIIGRSSGSEECDRRVENDYLLTESEKDLTALVCGAYRDVVIVCNSVGTIDLSWIRSYPNIRSVVFMGPGGECGAGALAGVLMGDINPSGKLPYTFANAYEDYPSAGHFSFNKDDNANILTYADYGLSAEENGSKGFEVSPVTVYAEDIYNGYRYFDTFNQPVLYGFGHGLSYTDFQIETTTAVIMDGKLSLSIQVQNAGDTYAGKEVVQLYVSSPSVRLESAKRELKAYEKTKLLEVGEKETLELDLPLEELAHFSEEESAYIIEKGSYVLYIGSSLENSTAVYNLIVSEDIVTRRVSADIGLQACNKDKLAFLHRENRQEVPDHLPTITLHAEDVQPQWPLYQGHDYTVEAIPSKLKDVYEGRVSKEAFVKQLTVEEMAVLCCGYGSGLPFSGIGQEAPVTIQYENGEDIGYGSHPTARMGFQNASIKRAGIYSAGCTDGPAFVGDTAWPTATPLASTFNKDLLEEFGEACAQEVRNRQMDSWLAPGLNLVRNPLCGRNFEYFSEDPLLAGWCGIKIAQGALKKGVTMCPKHFALNEQETYRRGSKLKKIDAVDSIITAKAARELYLKPFEMIITKTKTMEIMSSFNKINGTFAAGNKVLCTEILRGEWGFDGAVVTDWGDMDYVVDGADALAAGNDVVMPGGPPVIREILKGYEEGRITMEELYEASLHQLNFILSSPSVIQKLKEK